MTQASAPLGASFLATRKGRLTLVFLLVVALLDFIGIALVNVALPSIQRDLHFSQQNLQWVISGYVVTYGGFMLLGGRLADLLGRRVTLVLGTAVFGIAAIIGGAAPNAGTLVGARLAQGLGAALMTPAGLSILTTSFNTGTDRVKALGAWGAMGGLASVLGVFLGGVISAGPGWRWVFYVNPPICAVVIIAAYLLVSGEAPRRSGLASFDALGALLGTGAMLLLIYALVKAPDNGWGSAATIGELAGAGVLLGALVINELRHPNPVLPLSIFRIKGLAATDAAQVLGLAGFNSAFFFITLYMQEVLHFSALRAGAAYVPIAAIVAVGSIGGSGLVPRLGTRPLIIAGPEGIEMRLTQLMEALFENSSKTKQRFDLSVIALKPWETRAFGAVNVTPLPVVHGESGGPFLAYRVEAEGRVIAYSADTEWTETLVPLARDADLFIAEAYYYDKVVKNHLSLKTLEAHLPEIKPKRLILTHMSDDMLGRLDTLDYVAANDGMIVEL